MSEEVLIRKGTGHPEERLPEYKKGMKLLTDEEIAEVAVVCWAALEEHEKASFRLVAKAQALLTREEIKQDLLALLKDASDLSDLERRLVEYAVLASPEEGRRLKNERQDIW